MLIHRTRVSSAICGSLNTWDRRRKRKSTATAARFESTRTVAATRPQPPIHPSQGPNARVAQVKVVPESGIAVLSSRYPKTTRSIGTKPMSSTDGVWRSEEHTSELQSRGHIVCRLLLVQQ